MKFISRFLLLSSCVLFCSSCSHQSDKQFQGYIEGSYTYLSAPLAGKLIKLPVMRGDQVVAGKLIFALDPQPEADQLKQAQGNLQQAKQTLADLQKGQRPDALAAIKAQRAQVLAKLIYDHKTFLRYRRLHKTGALDKASVDAALANYQSDVKKIKELNANLAEAKLGARSDQIKAQQAVVAAAVATVNQAKWSLTQKTKYAPCSGVIFNTYYNIGELVNAGQPVASMLAPGNVKLVFFVPEKLLSKIAVGQEIRFSCDGCSKHYVAKIRFISNEAEYTPPVIYSRSSRAKLVYRVEARFPVNTAKALNVGQPVDVTLNSKREL